MSRCSCTLTMAILLVAFTAEGQAVEPQEAFLGTWVNTDAKTPGITKLVISRDESGWNIRAWGACHPVDCDWGTATLHLLGDSARTTALPYGLAIWDPGFSATFVTLRLDKAELMAEAFTVFKDESGRSNYRNVYRFRRDPPKAERE